MEGMTVTAKRRAEVGRGDTQRLRREGMVPAIIYGGEGVPIPISCEAREIAVRMKDESFHSTLIDLDVEGEKIQALVRAVQMHPYKQQVLHMDFQAVRADSEIATQVPLHYINVEESPGVKLRHGIFTSVENQVAVHCLPKDLPEFINVDIADLDIGKSVHLSDLTPPAGVTFDAIVRGNDPALATISEPKGEEIEETPEAEETETAAPDSV